MSQKGRKKLIEVALPLEAINLASEKEKNIRKGNPSTLHYWWARRPLATARAVLFAQLVDDPGEYAETLLHNKVLRKKAEVELNDRLLDSENCKVLQESKQVMARELTLQGVAADIERKRLFQIIEDLVQWKNLNNKTLLDQALAEIKRCCGNQLPVICDPFSGGCTIPFAAQRLGLSSRGSDLNPVAVMIGKSMIEMPYIFRNTTPVNPERKQNELHPNAEGMAKDVEYYGEWIKQQAAQQIGHLYPKVNLPARSGGGTAEVIAWIWARTVPSPDPAFSDAYVPLASSFLLSAKKEQEAWVNPIVNHKTKEIKFQINIGGSSDEIEIAKKGSKTRGKANFRCLLSKAAISSSYIRKMGKDGCLGKSMMAIVAKGNRRKEYINPCKVHVEAAESAVPLWKPDTEMPKNPRWFSPPAYGIERFGELFSNR